MQIGKKNFVIYLIVAFLAGALISGGMSMVFRGSSAVESSDQDSTKLDQLYQNVKNSYYKDVDQEVLMEGAYRGFIEALEDPYSAYMTAEEYENWMTSVTGDYSGIGITFSQDQEGNFVIVSVEKDSPAEEAGLKEGDHIIKADGKGYKNMDILAENIRGEEGTEVEVTYSRDGKENTVVMKRRHIVQHSVSYEMLDENTAYISVISFIESTGEDFKKAVDAVEKKGADNMILDLRDNGGGLLNTCIEVADVFLDEGVVVYVEDREKNREEYKAEDGKTELETVVLINENSASAAEILAVAMQDNEFELVGQTSFGKGVIQMTTPLDDGSALKLTVMQYFSPNGKTIHENGVEPDYSVKNKEGSEEDAQLQKARSLLQ